MLTASIGPLTVVEYQQKRGQRPMRRVGDVTAEQGTRFRRAARRRVAHRATLTPDSRLTAVAGPVARAPRQGEAPAGLTSSCS